MPSFTIHEAGRPFVNVAHKGVFALNDVFREYIKQAEDDLTSVFRLLEASQQIDPGVVRRDIASVIVQLYGLRRCGETRGAFPHPIVLSGRIQDAPEISLRCGAD